MFFKQLWVFAILVLPDIGGNTNDAPTTIAPKPIEVRLIELLKDNIAEKETTTNIYVSEGMKKKTDIKNMNIREKFRNVFNNPNPPHHIWEPEFDYCDEQLHKVAQKNWVDITRGDLSSYYILNLIYNDPLQQELFDYLFPICLAIWAEELISNQQSDLSDQLYRAFRREYIWNDMMSSDRKESVFKIISQVIIDRLSAENNFLFLYTNTPAYTWIEAIQELNECLPLTQTVWENWWAVDTHGKAICALMYASCLIFDEGENPIFHPWTAKLGGGCPDIMIPTLEPNRTFFLQTMTPLFLAERTQKAAIELKHSNSYLLAEYIATEIRDNPDIIQIKLEDLLVKKTI